MHHSNQKNICHAVIPAAGLNVIELKFGDIVDVVIQVRGGAELHMCALLIGGQGRASCICCGQTVHVLH